MNKLIYLLMSLALAAQCSCQSNGEIYLQKDSTSCLSCPGLEDKTEGVMWSSQNARGTIWLCRNSLEIFNQSNGDPLFIDYKCKTDQLCLYQIKKHYPSEYQCYHGDSIENVKANFIGKFWAWRRINLIEGSNVFNLKLFLKFSIIYWIIMCWIRWWKFCGEICLETYAKIPRDG